MSLAPCSSAQPAHCATEKRRGLVRASGILAGIDYVEVDPGGTSLIVHFFGRPPDGLSLRNVVIEGGRRIRGIRVLSAQFFHHDDSDICLHVTIDKPGDFSTYCICLIEPIEAAAECLGGSPSEDARKIPSGIDPRYACAPLLFRTDCPSDLDCKPQPCAPEPILPPPAINYLARDFQSFRQLILDRLQVTMGQWRERHIPDIGITVVELIAYVLDHLSYSLDAVATESLLATARRRISVRRHARLVDYHMHEGCNARAWVSIESDSDLTMEVSDLAFAAPPTDALVVAPGLVDWETLRGTDGTQIFEVMDVHGTGEVSIVAAHSEIHFYTWEDVECCLPAGSTRATLLDEPKHKDANPSPIPAEMVPKDVKSSAMAPERPLRLKEQDVLILEEIRGPRTGAPADADPTKRHVVRVTRVKQTTDPLNGVRVLEIEWSREDALPFTLCLSARTDAPDCEFVETAVVRGNVVLVDHGMTVADGYWVVEATPITGCCGCEGAPVDVSMVAQPFSITLAKPQLAFSEVIAPGQARVSAASVLLKQDPRKALAAITLDDDQPVSSSKPDTPAKEIETPVWRNKWDWISKGDLLSSTSTDRHFVVEMDDEGFAHLRFSIDDCGWRPDPGLHFRALYRIGNSTSGNVGRDTIIWIARKSGLLSGPLIRPRNPMPAVGGTAPEPVSEVKLFAPHAYSRVLERAVAAADYAELAGRDARLESTYAELAWTGSWYEANVALDLYARAEWDASLAGDIAKRLDKTRRIGHDLRIVPARKVPLVIGLAVCVAPHYSQSDVGRAIREVLSNGRLNNGSLGLFHPDNFEFGTDIKASRIIAAVQALEGVQHVEITEFRRQDTPPGVAAAAKVPLTSNFIEIHRGEIALLDNDWNFPEHGILNLKMRG